MHAVIIDMAHEIAIGILRNGVAEVGADAPEDNLVVVLAVLFDGDTAQNGKASSVLYVIQNSR